jgi:hypothetical protein
MTGDVAEMSRRTEKPLAESWERGHLFGLSTLELGPGTLRWLAADEPQRGREQADAVIALWSNKAQHQRYGHVVSHLQVDLYEGRSEQALQRLREAWQWMWRAGLLVPPGTRCRILDLRARATLMEAVKRGPKEAGRLLRAALQDARRLERLGASSGRAMAELVRAQVAVARGRPQAVEALDRAVEALGRAGLKLHAAAASVQLGELQGGREGRRRAASARKWMKQQGIARPEKMVAMFAPMDPQA